MRARRSGYLGKLLLGIGIGLTILFAISLLPDRDSDKIPTDPKQPSIEYKNEGYQVPGIDLQPPPLPWPKTDAEVEGLLLNNAFYDVEVANPVRCEVGAAPRTGTIKAAEKHFNAQIGCMMRVWGPVLEQAGWTAVRPSVTVYDTPIQTRCGESSPSNASYCGADQQIYVASDLLTIVPGKLREAPFMVDFVLAHEFGHAIQGRTGILVSELIQEKASSTKNRKEMSRRLEVQADCLAGMYMNSVAQSVSFGKNDRGAVSSLAYSIGDDVLTRDPNFEGGHGHGRSRQLWTERGIGASSVATCNTFKAPADQVR